MKRFLATLMILVSMVAVVAVSSVAAQTIQQQLQAIQDELRSLHRTVEQIPPTWNKILPASTRFVLVMGGEAVLDRETGLVWEKEPSTAPANWYNALHNCADAVVGGRKGWHLPTVEQLASLVDTSVSGSPKLPAGHPFTGLVTNFPYYWTADRSEDIPPNTGDAFFVDFSDGSVQGQEKVVTNYNVWCVRGGQSHDGL